MTRYPLRKPMTREKLIEAYIDMSFDNFRANRPSVDIDWTDSNEIVARAEAISLSDSELLQALGL